MSALSFNSASNAWQVFMLFAVPIGGGIPAGVVLAQSRGIGWLAMIILYFVSDILLAIIFEPTLKIFLWATTKSRFLARVHAVTRDITNKTIASYGAKPGPFLLILIAFGVDPMTGRAAAFARGHGFLAGWAIAIAGDMLFFTVVMASTSGTISTVR